MNWARSLVHEASFELDVEPGKEHLAEAWVEFEWMGQGSAPGVKVSRPAFWTGGRGFRVRFAAPRAGLWRRTLHAPGPQGRPFGEVECQEAPLLQPHPCQTCACWSNGGPILFAVDTAWALPWRASLEEAREYAKDRQAKGFNAALLMTIQPDTKAEGPLDPLLPGGFRRLVEGLEEGELGRPILGGWEEVEELILTLLDHGIVPFHTPLFFGFGWKGLDVIGPKAEPGQAARLARMLDARFGAWPAVWLAGADGTGQEPAVEAMGQELAKWTSQPIGIHYNPWQDGTAHAAQEWARVHLIQTGHSEDHRPDRAARLAAQSPGKMTANGEPTYEGMKGGVLAGPAWQAKEAWMNLCCGTGFGVFYGAGSLWQWKREGEEDHWDSWCCAPWDWRAALGQPGSAHVGRIGRLLSDIPCHGLKPDDKAAFGAFCVSRRSQGVLELAIAFFPKGGQASLERWDVTAVCRAYDVLTGAVLAEVQMDPGPQWPPFSMDLPAGTMTAVIIQAGSTAEAGDADR